MNNFQTLRLLDFFRSSFEKSGVDYPIMRRLLQVKLTMDRRRVPTLFSQSARKKQSETSEQNSFIKSLWVYLLLGLIMVPFILMGQNYIFQMSFVFGILMFMTMTSMIADFSSVLLDVRDRNIIGSKPVSRKTSSMAKIIHISIYLFFLTGSLAFASLVTAFIKNGILFFLLFVLEIVLMDVLIIALTALLYLLILKFFDGEKLKDIINNVQIVLSITLAVGFQLVGRSFDFLNIHFEFQARWWQTFVIPFWFGAPFEWLLQGQGTPQFILFTILAFVMPLIAILIYSKLMPAFEQNLQKLLNHNPRKRKRNQFLLKSISKFICSDKDERTFFQFAIHMMIHERDFKLKVYPSIGFSLIFPFIFILNKLKEDGLSGLASSKFYICIYVCAMMIPTVLMMLKYSAQYKGAWIYKTVPFQNARSIFKGTIKAFIVRLFLPVFIIESILFMLLFGIRIFPDIIIVFLNCLLYTVICFHFLRKSLPFSEPFEAMQHNESFTVFGLVMLITVLGGIHFALTFWDGSLYPYMAALLITNLIVWRKGFNITWEKLASV
jgi:ABC-2 type transport system permease protein